MRGVTEAPPWQRNLAKFQPALPIRGVTTALLQSLSPIQFQPALPMRGVTSDLLASDQRGYISTRTPHAGSDAVSILENLAEIFQPALPMRGVTSSRASPLRWLINFNPHSPCGE